MPSGIRTLHGPYGFQEIRSTKLGGPPRELRWHFFGLRENLRMGHWALIFDVTEGKWKVGVSQLKTPKAPPDREIIAATYGGKIPRVHPGSIKNLMRLQLPPEEMAKAARFRMIKR